ncbi:MAG: hypothetical protein WBA01_20125 [Phormidesmis sp.]
MPSLLHPYARFQTSRMILLILTIVIGLVFWALRLMDRAIENQEFSLMLAGFLVASSAAAIVGIYFLMSDYLMFINHAGTTFDEYDTAFDGYDNALMSSDLPAWLNQID